MGGLSIWHLLIVALLFVLLFGKGKISDLMGDVAKGVKNFKQGMADDDEPKADQSVAPAPVATVAARVAAPAKKPVVKKVAAKKPAAKKAAPKVTLAIEHKPAAKAPAKATRKPRATKS